MMSEAEQYTPERARREVAILRAHHADHRFAWLMVGLLAITLAFDQAAEGDWFFVVFDSLLASWAAVRVYSLRGPRWKS